MKTRWIFSLVILTILALSSCSSIKVVTDYDKEVDFAQYDTFSFLPWDIQNGKRVNDLDKLIIYKAIANEMRKKGYVKADSGDLRINVQVILDEKTGTKAYTNYYSMGGYGYGYGGYGGYGYGGYAPFGYGHATTTYQDFKYTDGTLIIDIFDAKDKKLIFQGGATGTLDSNSSAKERQATASMMRLFAQFPKVKKPKRK